MLTPDRYGYLAITEVVPDAIATFQCGKPRLDDFLKSAAADLHRARLSFTHIVFHEQVEGPVGFFTLSNDAIPLNESEKFDLGIDSDISMSSFPAVKVGRLAVSQNIQREGIGLAIMDLVIGEILDSRTLSAGRLLIVDADNDPAVLSFYKKIGFEKSLWAEGRSAHHTKLGRPAPTIKMHLDILKTQIL